MGEGHSSHCIEGVRSWEVEGGGRGVKEESQVWAVQYIQTVNAFP